MVRFAVARDERRKTEEDSDDNDGCEEDEDGRDWMELGMLEMLEDAETAEEVELTCARRAERRASERVVRAADMMIVYGEARAEVWIYDLEIRSLVAEGWR